MNGHDYDGALNPPDDGEVEDSILCRGCCCVLTELDLEAEQVHFPAPICLECREKYDEADRMESQAEASCG
jgi:hypothetical protein